jgi:hypothetical protein
MKTPIEDKDINAIIAEADGWQDCKDGTGLTQGEDGLGLIRCKYPDYCNDLNALQSALMKRSIKFRADFRRNLEDVIHPRRECIVSLMSVEQYDKWFFATARERALAYIMTI